MFRPVMKASDFPEGTEFYDIDWIPAAWLPDARDPENWLYGTKGEFDETTLNNLDTKADRITPEEFDEMVARSLAELDTSGAPASKELASHEPEQDG